MLKYLSYFKAFSTIWNGSVLYIVLIGDQIWISEFMLEVRVMYQYFSLRKYAECSMNVHFNIVEFEAFAVAFERFL